VRDEYCEQSFRISKTIEGPAQDNLKGRKFAIFRPL
jgi:hypothetical protein